MIKSNNGLRKEAGFLACLFFLSCIIVFCSYNSYAKDGYMNGLPYNRPILNIEVEGGTVIDSMKGAFDIDSQGNKFAFGDNYIIEIPKDCLLYTSVYKINIIKVSDNANAYDISVTDPRNSPPWTGAPSAKLTPNFNPDQEKMCIRDSLIS